VIADAHGNLFGMLVNCEVQHERVLLGRIGEPSATPC
jgi:hypothetical protein